MIKEFLVSFKDNINTKTSNPFFGTLILVWIKENWNLFYSLFNFDYKTPLAEKREFIITHFTDKPFTENLLLCVFATFIILIISYILINFSRLIVNFFDKQITPLVYKWTDEKSIVLKSVYDISENERKRLEKRVEEERETKLKLQEEYDKLEKRLAELLAKNSETKVPEQIEQKTKLSTINFGEEKILLLLNKLQKENKIENFEKIVSDILNNDAVYKANELVKELTTLGLIVPGNPVSNTSSFYSLTELGRSLHEKLLMNKLK